MCQLNHRIQDHEQLILFIKILPTVYNNKVTYNFIIFIRIKTKQQMNYREVSCLKLINIQFIGVVLFIAFNYFVYVVEFMINRKPAPYILLLVIFHILFILLIISMVKSILGDPGRVPIYWGFFAEDS